MDTLTVNCGHLRSVLDDGSVSVASDAATIPDICKSSKKVFVGKIPPSAKPQDIKVFNFFVSTLLPVFI